MNLSAWLYTAVFILFTLGFGVFRKSLPRAQAPDLCQGMRASPWLCGQKMALAEAGPGDLALVDGLSLKSARRILAFINAHPKNSLSIKDLQRVKGVGPKTVVKLKSYFY